MDVFDAIRVIKEECMSHANNNQTCDACPLSNDDGLTCRLTEDIPIDWDIEE